MLIRFDEAYQKLYFFMLFFLTIERYFFVFAVGLLLHVENKFV